MFDNMIADMECNEKLSPAATALFLKRRKLSISLGYYITILFQGA